MRARRDNAQVLPLVLVVLALTVGVVIVVGRLGVRAQQRAQAHTAADAAALAGAAEGRGAAEELARVNGAVLIGYEVDGAEVQVEVRVGDATASARSLRTSGVIPTTYSGSDVSRPARRGGTVSRGP